LKDRGFNWTNNVSGYLPEFRLGLLPGISGGYLGVIGVIVVCLEG
jgi:hypothetical protein